VTRDYNALTLVLVPLGALLATALLLQAAVSLFYTPDSVPGFVMALVYALPLTVAIWWTLRRFGIRLYPDFSLPPPKVFWGIVVLYIPLMWIVEIISSFLPPTGKSLEAVLNFITDHPGWSFLTIVILAPLLEELLFRRIILHFLLKKYPPARAVVISALAFAFFHFNIWQGIGALILGLYLGYVYWRTRSYWMTVFLHFITNATGFWSIYIHQSLDSTASQVPWEARLAALTLSAALFYWGIRRLDRLMARLPRTYYLASGNPHKIRELKALIPEGYRIRPMTDLGFEGPLPETGRTLEENSRQKALYLARLYGVDTLADDTGLETEALDGKPGVHTARFAGPDADDAKNRALLLEKLKEVDNRRARFRTVITLSEGHRVYQFEGKAEGHIARVPAGEGGFGYDPLFVPDEGDGRTYAEMTEEEKNRTSHRAKAVRQLVEFLRRRFSA